MVFNVVFVLTVGQWDKWQMLMEQLVFRVWAESQCHHHSKCSNTYHKHFPERYLGSVKAIGPNVLVCTTDNS